MLCPKIGNQPTPPPPVPDFIPDRDLAEANRAFRRYNDEDYDTVANWAEYCARQKSTYHHLERCLEK